MGPSEVDHGDVQCGVEQVLAADGARAVAPQPLVDAFLRQDPNSKGRRKRPRIRAAHGQILDAAVEGALSEKPERTGVLK